MMITAEKKSIHLIVEEAMRVGSCFEFRCDNNRGIGGGKRSIPYVLQSKLPQNEQIFFMDGSVEISLRISMKIVKI